MNKPISVEIISPEPLKRKVVLIAQKVDESKEEVIISAQNTAKEMMTKNEGYRIIEHSVTPGDPCKCLDQKLPNVE